MGSNNKNKLITKRKIKKIVGRSFMDNYLHLEGINNLMIRKEASALFELTLVLYRTIK